MCSYIGPQLKLSRASFRSTRFFYTPVAPQSQAPVPNNGEPPSACELANIAAVNSVSNLNVSPANVVGEPFVFNGALNVNFSVAGASPSSLPAGRYPSSLLDKIFGIGSSLHVPAAGGSDPSTYGIDRGRVAQPPCRRVAEAVCRERFSGALSSALSRAGLFRLVVSIGPDQSEPIPISGWHKMKSYSRASASDGSPGRA